MTASIQPGTPVITEDARGVCRWGTARSTVRTDRAPWPVVEVEFAGTRTCLVPARQVEAT